MEPAFELLLLTASGAGEAVAGAIRVTVSDVVGTEVIPAMFARLHIRQPDPMLELDLSDDVADALLRGADVAVRMLRPAQADLLARRVGTEWLGLYEHISWLERHGLPETPEALVRSRRLIGYDRIRQLIDAFAVLGVQIGRTNFGFRSDSNLAPLAAIRAGLGAAVCQLPIAACDPQLVRLFPEFEGMLEIWPVTHPNFRGSARVRTCLDALAAGFAAYATD